MVASNRMPSADLEDLKVTIKLTFAGRPAFETLNNEITLGSDPNCCVAFPAWVNVKSKHAVIRSIDGQWLIETREGDSVVVNGGEPRPAYWLLPGDEIRLSPQSAAMTFQLGADQVPLVEAPTAHAEPDSAALIEPQSFETEEHLPTPAAEDSLSVLFLSDSESDIPTLKGESKAVDPTRKRQASQSPRKSKSSSSMPIAKVTSTDTMTIKTSNSTTDPSLRAIPEKRSPSDPAVKLPMLKRSLSRDVELDDFDEAPGARRRKRLSPEQEEMRWVMTVVTRCVGGGLLVILVLVVIRWLVSAFSPVPI